MGSDEGTTIFHIRYSLGFDYPISVMMDREYPEEKRPGLFTGEGVVKVTDPDVKRIDRTEFRLRVPTKIVSQYKYMILIYPARNSGAGATGLFARFLATLQRKPTIYPLAIPKEDQTLRFPLAKQSEKPI